MAVLAVRAIRRLRGGSQGHLMLGADDRLWVVKFQNNPQHLRVLANELIASGLAEAVGLTVPTTDIIDVPESLVRDDPAMSIDLPGGRKERYLHGQQFGSAFVGGLMPGQVVEYLPEKQLADVCNLGEFAGILAFDKWTGNCDGRQAVFNRTGRERTHKATFIDYGFCFNAAEWNFPDAPLRGIYRQRIVYSQVSGWDSFEPWLSRIEAMEPTALWQIAETVPPLWYDNDANLLERLIQQLLDRRARVRELIIASRDCDRDSFPTWVTSA